MKETNSPVGKTLIKINHDIALKSLIFGMIFYVIASPYFVYSLDQFLPIGFDTVVIQAILFAIVYYLVESAI
jgi:hypothetical protein